jgi:hypothetical protein
LANFKEFDANDFALCAVDSVNKQYLMYYGVRIATKEWLINACLKQQTKIDDLNLEELNF